MRVLSQFLATFALLALFSAAAFAQSAADKAMMEDSQKMHHAMAAAPLTGDADKDFVSKMIPHHAGAIDMAKTELQYGKDPELRALAQGIVAAQEKEIGQMKEWQAQHGVK